MIEDPATMGEAREALRRAEIGGSMSKLMARRVVAALELREGALNEIRSAMFDARKLIPARLLDEPAVRAVYDLLGKLAGPGP